jgi:hypothetical protein
MLFIDVPWATYVVAVLLPVLIALVTAKGGNSAWSAVLLAVFSAATAVITAAIQGADTGVDLNSLVLLGLTTFTVAVSAHFGFWKPTGVTGDDGKVRTAIPGGMFKPADVVDIED